MLQSPLFFQRNFLFSDLPNQTHVFDNATPVEETYRTMDDLVRCGKVRYVGVSNVSGWQLQKIADTQKELGLNPIVSLQVGWYYFETLVGRLVRLLGWLVAKSPSSVTRLSRGRVPRLMSENFTCCHTETEQEDHDFCLSRSHYTDIDPTSKERAARAGIEPTIS